MVDLNKVSAETKNLVNQIKSTGGDPKKIDTAKEAAMLSNALAGTCNPDDQEYMKAVLDTYNAPTSCGASSKANGKSSKKAPKTKAKNYAPKPSIQNNTSTQNNNVNGAHNNTINGNGNTIIIKNGNNVPNSNGVGSSAPAQRKQQAQPAKSKPLSPAEVKRAREMGEDAADLLVGYTTDSEQMQVKSLLAQVDQRNVMEFLRGYTENKGMGDPFFTQMRTENGFKAKQNLMHTIAKRLEGYLVEKYGANNKVAKEVSVILLESQFTREETGKLDRIVRDELRK